MFCSENISKYVKLNTTLKMYSNIIQEMFELHFKKTLIEIYVVLILYHGLVLHKFRGEGKD